MQKTAESVFYFYRQNQLLMKKQAIAYTASTGIDRSRWYIGGLFTFLATGDDTNGEFSCIEVLMRKGLEPPRHSHSMENETVYVIAGEMKFVVDKEEYFLKAGDFIFLPKNIPHHFEVQSETIKFLVHTMPAGLEQMFITASIPAEQAELPPRPSGPPHPSFLQKLGELQQQYGITVHR